MKRIPFVFALALFSALPALAQATTEFGVLVGGSRRFVDGAPKEANVEFADSTFSLSNNTFDLYWAIPIDPVTALKIKAGRIETQVPVAYQLTDDGPVFRRDEEGEVSHIEANVEYRFSEPFGSTGLFGGVGFYRQTPEESDASSAFGFNAGVSADFPLTRRYGVILEATYHWVRTEFQPRYLTVGAGMRIAF